MKTEHRKELQTNVLADRLGKLVQGFREGFKGRPTNTSLLIWGGSNRPITAWDLVMKWLFDHFVGAVVLLMALPVMALVALAIKLDSPGPVLFRQKRFSFNNERIDVESLRLSALMWEALCREVLG